MAKYVLSLGSNVDNAADMICKSFDFLEHHFEVVNRSAIYSTPSIKADDFSVYHNAVAEIYSDIPLNEIESMLKGYERACGRDKAIAPTRVPIDIDVVMAEGMVLRERDFNRDYFRIGYRQIDHAD